MSGGLRADGRVRALVILAWWVGAAAGCDSLIYPAPQRDPHRVPDDVRVLSLNAADGTPVHALACAGQDPAAPVIVYFHGNGNVAGDGLGLARYVAQRGPSMLLAEYRGYGASVAAGPPSEEGLYADAEAVLVHLRGEGIAAERVVLWGYSLGSAVAAEMAVRGHGARLVLQAPFTSIVGVGEERFPWAPVSWLLSDRFDTGAKAPRIGLPTLVVHGEDDEIVPFEMGKTLAASIPRATLLAVPGMTHSGGKDFRWVVDRIVAFATSGAEAFDWGGARAACPAIRPAACVARACGSRDGGAAGGGATRPRAGLGQVLGPLGAYFGANPNDLESNMLQETMAKIR